MVSILVVVFNYKKSRSNAARVAGEERALANILQAKEQLDHAFESERTPCMRRCTIGERLHIVLDQVHIHSLHFRLFH